MALGPPREFGRRSLWMTRPAAAGHQSCCSSPPSSWRATSRAELERNPLLERRTIPTPLRSRRRDTHGSSEPLPRATGERRVAHGPRRNRERHRHRPSLTPFRTRGRAAPRPSQEGPTLPSLDGPASRRAAAPLAIPGLEDLVAGGLSLHDHLERQTLPLLDTHGDRAIALALIESIEDTAT